MGVGLVDEAKHKRHMLTGEARRVLRVGDVVERDIDGIWFPAEVSVANSRRKYVWYSAVMWLFCGGYLRGLRLHDAASIFGVLCGRSTKFARTYTAAPYTVLYH